MVVFVHETLSGAISLCQTELVILGDKELKNFMI